MKNILLTIALCSTSALLFAQVNKTEALKLRLQGIDPLIEQVMKDWQVPGLAIGIVYKDQLLYSKGFGYRDLEQQLPVTPHTIFPIASCTKAFTAALVGLAADKNLLEINQPVNRYFPELEFYTPQMTAMVTAKDMMTHRTGLPRHDWVTHAKESLPMDTVIHRVRYLEPSRLIRDEVQYTNLMYNMLGELTRKVTGRSWSQQIKEMIFAPLQMNESSTAFSDLIKSAEYSKGYFLRRDTLVSRNPSTEGANAAGSINSSVLDMSHWLIAWINGGRYKDNQVFPAKLIREASTPQMSAPSRPNPAFPAYPDAFFGDMGYGWIIDSYRGHYHVQHSGDLPTYSSNTSFFLTDSIGIVVLVNKFNATVPELISSLLADRLLELPYKDWNRLLLALHKKRSADTGPLPTTGDTAKPVMNRPLVAYAGAYYHPGYGSITLSVIADKLYATHNEQSFAISIAGKDEFIANVPGGRLRVIIDKKGKVISLAGSFEEGIREIVFTRLRKRM